MTTCVTWDEHSRHSTQLQRPRIKIGIMTFITGIEIGTSHIPIMHDMHITFQNSSGDYTVERILQLTGLNGPSKVFIAHVCMSDYYKLCCLTHLILRVKVHISHLTVLLAIVLFIEQPAYTD